MAILKTCCCWKSVRRGSFASGIFTLGFYTIVFTAGAFHINTVFSSTLIFTLSVITLFLSGFCVFSSILLLVGLCADNRLMLLPWIVSISLVTILDFILSFYLIVDGEVDPVIIVLFAMDFLICGLNVYSLLCVVSQYQEYLARRGRGALGGNIQPIPIVRFQRSSDKERQVSIKFEKRIDSVDRLAAPTFSVSSKSQISTDFSSISFDPSDDDPSRLHPNHNTQGNADECCNNGIAVISTLYP